MINQKELGWKNKEMNKQDGAICDLASLRKAVSDIRLYGASCYA